MPASLLIVDDEKHTREGLQTALESSFDVYVARDADEALLLMESEHFDAVLTDLKMAGKSGMSIIDSALKLPSPPVCIMMTAYGDVPTAVEAMKRGAFDFLTKPVNLDKLEIMLKRALQMRNLELQNTALTAQVESALGHDTDLIGKSPAFQKILSEAQQVAPSKASVLLLGETGTGKERLAQLIHEASSRTQGPFIAVHCASLAPQLLESELFGHEKGAFTGAHERRIGRFEAANHGTLFLDELGEIDSSIQIKLLRFLETKRFERVGSSKFIEVDVRLIAATNRNLQEDVAAGRFREDLYYRLNVVPITLPALRERTQDIPDLMAHYLQNFAQENRLPIPKLTTQALSIMKSYRWPGNIRELRNLCENLVVTRRGADITPADLTQRFLSDTINAPTKQPLLLESREPTQRLCKSEHEKALYYRALRESRGNKTRAATLLGVSRRTLQRKLQEWPDILEHDNNIVS